MKRFLFSLICFVVALVSATPASAQDFLLGNKPEKKWFEIFYKNQNTATPAPKPAQLLSSNSGPAGVIFFFTSTPDVSMFTTKHPSYNEMLLGDMTGRTVRANYTVIASQPFTFYGQGTPSNAGSTAASVRLYFDTNNNELGYSQMWWCKDGKELVNGADMLACPLNPENWSDWDGHNGAQDAAHRAAFAAAVADIQQIGVSFGGGWFYANGVGSPGASFAFTNFEVVP